MSANRNNLTRSIRLALNSLRSKSTTARLLAVSLLASGVPATLGHTATIQPHAAKAVVSAAATRARLIIRTTGTLTDVQKAQLTKLGCDIYRNLPIVQSLALSIPQANVAKLTALPFVAHVSPDEIAHKTDAFTEGSSGSDTAFATYGLTGYGVGVAVIDSGIASVPDNSQAPAGVKLPLGIPAYRIISQQVFVPGKGTNDECGHGTHVAGILGGDGAASYGAGYTQTFFGIARFCNLISLRVLDQTGSGTTSNVMAAIQWAVTNKAKYNIRIINLSLGQPVCQSYTTDPLCQTCEAAWNAGILVVCAAGNDGHLNATQATSGSNEGWGTNYGSIESPGNDPLVLTVGATKSVDGIRADDTIATYSSRGPSLGDFVVKPDIVAPGNQIISDLAPNSYLQQQYASTNSVPLATYENVKPKNGTAVSTNYFILSGTSMATPVVCGAAAMMLQANPALTPDTIKARLMMTADPITFSDGTTDVLTFGAGYLDIMDALQSNLVATSPARSPSVYLDPTGVVRVKADNALWGGGATQNSAGTWTINPNASIWGTGETQLTSLYGQNALWGSGTLNSNTALWGNDTLTASTALWGDTALWGNSTLSANNALWGSDTPVADLSSIAVDGDMMGMFDPHGYRMKVNLKKHHNIAWHRPTRQAHHVLWGD